MSERLRNRLIVWANRRVGMLYGVHLSQLRFRFF